MATTPSHLSFTLSGLKHKHTLLVKHCLPVFLPAGVLAHQPPVVIDQRFQSLRQTNNVGSAVNLDPIPEKRVGENANRSMAIIVQILNRATV